MSEKRNGECCEMMHVLWISIGMHLEHVSHDLLVAVFPVPARPYALGIGGIPSGWDPPRWWSSKLMALKPGQKAIKPFVDDLGGGFPFVTLCGH